MTAEERAELEQLRAMRAEAERLWALHDGVLGVWTRRDILRAVLNPRPREVSA